MNGKKRWFGYDKKDGSHCGVRLKAFTFGVHELGREEFEFEFTLRIFCTYISFVLDPSLSMCM
jgi:hypothetical protein